MKPPSTTLLHSPTKTLGNLGAAPHAARRCSLAAAASAAALRTLCSLIRPSEFRRRPSDALLLVRPTRGSIRGQGDQGPRGPGASGETTELDDDRYINRLVSMNREGLRVNWVGLRKD